MHKISAEDMRLINELRDLLNTVTIKLNQVVERGMQVKFRFNNNPATNKQELVDFEVLAPLDLSKTSS